MFGGALRRRSCLRNLAKESYEGRVDVPEDKPKTGNCFLLLKNVWNLQKLFYESETNKEICLSRLEFDSNGGAFSLG